MHNYFFIKHTPRQCMVYGVNFIYMCPVEAYDIFKVKNALAKSPSYVTECVIRSVFISLLIPLVISLFHSSQNKWTKSPMKLFYCDLRTSQH
jgi:hypothetical protein